MDFERNVGLISKIYVIPGFYFFLCISPTTITLSVTITLSPVSCELELAKSLSRKPKPLFAIRNARDEK